MNHAPRLILGVLTLLLIACREPDTADTAGTGDAATADPAAPPPAATSEYGFDIGGRGFDPAPGFAADFLPAVDKRIAERQEDFNGAPRSTYLLVQFHHPLDRTTRDQLERRGVTILDRVTAHTWTGSADLAGARSLMSDPAVRWADLYPDDVKLAPGARRPEPFDWQIRDGGRAAYSVLFHGDVGAREVGALAHTIPGLALEGFDAAIFEVLHTALVVIDPRDLDALASIQAVRWIEPDQPPTMDLNFDHAQPASNVNLVQMAPYSLTGRGVTIGIWEDKGLVVTPPLDLGTRVIAQAGQTTACDDHPVHVAGTIGASGEHIGSARGMAPQVTMASWDAHDETSEMILAAKSPGGPGNPTPIVASNHSYGAPVGWNDAGTAFAHNHESFGLYDGWTRRFDVTAGNTDLIISIAAGNDRDDAPADPAPGKPAADCRQGGLDIAADCIGPKASAKNVLTIGATDGTGSITGFSSFGPTDDGRVKPDLMAHGGSTLSLACNCGADVNGDGNADNVCLAEASRSMAGTSMATAVVTGVVALMLEQAGDLGIGITAAGMKALLIQTARDVEGTGPAHGGPDFATGWGIVDARAAADLLRQSPGSRLLHKTLDHAGPENAYTQSFTLPVGQAELRVTLAWTDLEGNPTDAPANPELFNDLDLRLISPDQAVFGPWTLDPDDPAAAAIRHGGDDTRNNVEQVSVLQPVPGTWILRVSAKPGSLAFGAQRFALAGSVPLDS